MPWNILMQGRPAPPPASTAGMQEALSQRGLQTCRRRLESPSCCNKSAPLTTSTLPSSGELDLINIINQFLERREEMMATGDRLIFYHCNISDWRHQPLFYYVCRVQYQQEKGQTSLDIAVNTGRGKFSESLKFYIGW